LHCNCTIFYVLRQIKKAHELSPIFIRLIAHHVPWFFADFAAIVAAAFLL